ncbi:HIT family protein [Candidatus Woesearchaeota archaeon]|nr:HIT family protein [Candidatus Woesearchaeota archaeon]MCF7901509.1 HIT family protein [Candidatus Woesearchaeota archaeon]MCF8013940.1 HIT family protein [Candidatus Woesearchaeota archaeon]
MSNQPDFSKMSPQEIAEYQKKNCIFCKIIAGEIPSKKVYEDKEFYAILDINPVTKGHILLMPKEHVQVMPQMQPPLVGSLAEAIQKISQKLLNSLNCKGTSVFIANGAVAGQKAPHFIIHIIPRKNGDEVPLNPKFEELNKDEWEETHKKVYKAIYGSEPDDNAKPGDETLEESEEEKKPEEKIEENDEKISEETSEDKNTKTDENKDSEDSEKENSEDSEDEVDLDKISNLFK